MGMIIQNGIIYSGGIATNGDFVNELLWDYVNDNSGTIPFGTYAVTLAKSIDAFDALIICLKSDYNDSGNWGSSNIILIDINALKTNPFNPNHFNYTSFKERSSGFYVNGTTFQKTIDNLANINGLVAVYGIKYGGNNIKYSTSEHIVGKWIDGSTIYEKTINVGSQSGADVSYNHNITNFGLLISIIGRCTQPSGDHLPLPYVGLNSTSWSVALGNVTSTQFRIQKGSGIGTLSDVYVTIRYTKSSASNTRSFSKGGSEESAEETKSEEKLEEPIEETKSEEKLEEPIEEKKLEESVDEKEA